jgi:hypothetical protein
MGTAPNHNPANRPQGKREDTEYFPTASQVLRCLVVWLHGFHLDREKPKFTDWLTVILTLLVAIAAFMSALIFQGQLDEARKSTRLSVRPWIGLDEGDKAIETSPLQIDANGNVSILYKISGKNYSNSPASNVWASANLVVADDTSTVDEQQGYACGDAMIGKPDIGMVLFQGKDRTFNETPGFTKINLKHKNSQIGVWLTGCIGYRDQFGYLCRTKVRWYMKDETNQGVILQSPVPAQAIKGHFVMAATGNGIDSCQIPRYP